MQDGSHPYFLYDVIIFFGMKGFEAQGIFEVPERIFLGPPHMVYNDIYDLQPMLFEDTYFYAPARSDAVLIKMYGENYMQLPNRYGVHKENPDYLFTEEY